MGAVSPGSEWSIPMFRADFLCFTLKSVEVWPNLPPAAKNTAKTAGEPGDTDHEETAPEAAEPQVPPGQKTRSASAAQNEQQSGHSHQSRPSSIKRPTAVSAWERLMRLEG